MEFRNFECKVTENLPYLQEIREKFVQNGPQPRHDVVVMAVRAAVIAATMTLRMTSQMFLPFIVFVLV